MAVTISNNLDDTIMLAMQAALQNASINGLPGFLSGSGQWKDVPILGSREEATERSFVGTPIAGLVYVSTDTFELPDLEVGCVLAVDLVVAVKGTSPGERSKALTRLINAARNTLNTSIPSDAHGFPEPDAGEYHPRMRIEQPERILDAEDPWAIAWLPVFVAYRTVTSVTH